MKMRILCVFPFLLLVLIFVTRSGDTKTRKIIINTDAGADDAAAILLALAYQRLQKDIEVVGIIVTYGNTYAENVDQNVLKILTVARRSDIPVYSGATKPIVSEYEPSQYFGKDGLGDFNFTQEIIAHVNRTKYGAVALIDLVKQHDDVYLISLGPLTNIALAMELDDHFLEHVKEIHIMGGTVAGWGNVRPNVEFNFAQDPESNYIVLNHTRANNCFLYPFEIMLKYPISKKWRTEIFGRTNSSAANFLNQAERISLHDSAIWNPSDVYAMAGMIWRELILHSLPSNVNAVIDGSARGAIVVDYLNVTGKPSTTTIIQDFNTTKLQELMLQHLG